MSAKWRRERGLGRASTPQSIPVPVDDHDDIVGTYAAYDPSIQSAAYFIGGNATEEIEDSTTFPVQHELWHTEAAGYTPDQQQFAGPGNSTYNLIDQEIGGQRGEINDLPYSLGVVSSDLVENFALTGEQAIIRRGRNPSDHGPVGTSDSNGMLSLRYAEQVNQYYPNERSQVDLIRAV